MSKGARGSRAKLLAGSASASDAGIVDPAATAPIGADAPVMPSEVVPAPPAGSEPDNAAVLPDPTLVAKPDAPQPIVTASPVLAAEPSALDVVQADAAADRVAAGVGDEADREAAHPAAAGQPTLTIESATAASVANGMADGAVDGIGDAARAALGTRDVFDDRFGRRLDEAAMASGAILSVETIEHQLGKLAERDPFSFNDLMRRFSDHDQSSFEPTRDRGVGGVRLETVRVVEVVGPARGRRRAGMMFGPQARRFLATDLRADEMDALMSDPQLAVGVTEMDAADADVTFADTMLVPGT